MNDIQEKFLNYIQKNRRKSFNLKEFDPDLDCVIFYSPVTVLDMDKIMTLSGGGSNTKDFHIFTILEKAETENGEKAFSIDFKPYLEKMDWDIISGLSNRIAKRIPIAEVKKTSETTPSC
jgi:hypothetical protein